jgi:hypothetical protein
MHRDDSPPRVGQDAGMDGARNSVRDTRPRPFRVEHVRTCHVDDEERLRPLNERAVCGDDAAVDQMVGDLLPVLRLRLRTRFATAPEELIHDATVDALMECRTNPTRYDPGRGVPVAEYLLFTARRDLLNRLDAERRRAAHEDITPDGVLPEPAIAPDEILWSGASSRIALRHIALTEAERTVFQLWKRGERKTSAYASALRLGPLPIAEQRETVNRIKDRVVRRIRRLANRLCSRNR